MKKLILTITVLSVMSVITFITSRTNPVQVHLINEFMFDTVGWKIELHPSNWIDSISLNGWYLTSKTDTAFFRNGLYLTFDQYKIFTQSDLQSHLNINRNSDSLVLYDELGAFPADRFFFGTPGSCSPSPKTGQSVNLLVYMSGPWEQYCYYLDNTPTFGFENDTLNVRGNIKGYVSDSLSNPIADVRVIYGYRELPGGGYDTIYVETNSLGYFILRDLSILKTLEFEKDGYYAPKEWAQIWPDSTVTINIQMQAVVGVTELPSASVNSFELSQNYPNPFNSSTSFNYSLSEDGFVEINIYDEKGELVQKLFNGNQAKGQYKVNWSADNLASGIYFYELSVRTPSEKTRTQKLSKKCLLLK